jgi:hypothetical protein
VALEDREHGPYTLCERDVPCAMRCARRCQCVRRDGPARRRAGSTDAVEHRGVAGVERSTRMVAPEEAKAARIEGR